jgi:hypothetical protein
VKAFLKDTAALAIIALSGALLIQSMSSTSIASEAPQAAASNFVVGTVIETMNSGGYTYVYLDTGAEKRWIAAPQAAVAAGDQVKTSQGMAMANFKSASLDREFELVYFVDRLENLSGDSTAELKAEDIPLPEGHPDLSSLTPAAEKIVVELEEGHSIEHLYANATDLAGKTYSLRGKVVKYSSGIFGTNWIHLQDGTGTAENGNYDLVVTSDYSTKVGDTITVSGTVALDKDFGYGYRYALIMEKADLQVEE